MTGRRTALLVATSEYLDDTRQLRESLLGSGFDEVVSVVNESKSGIERELERLLRARVPQDTFLLHVAGAVVRNDHGQSFLATAASDVTMPYSTAVPVMVVRQLLAECPAKTKIVVLAEAVDFGDGVQVHTATNADEVAGLLSSPRDRDVVPAPVPVPDVPPAPDFLNLLGISSVEEFDVQHAWGKRSENELLRAPIGTFDNGQPFELDIKGSQLNGMGPHGIVAGDAGSGRSQLLRTFVLALAATHSPEDVNFLLVDVRGSATFEDLAGLPHVSATVTRLQEDVALVDRLRDAVAGELNRRQKVLEDSGHRTGLDYQRAREEGADLAPLPTLVLVIDDFEELVAGQPNFMNVLIAVGRVGRSLRMHLLVAGRVQEENRPSPVETLVSYRLGLKTSAERLSTLLLGGPEAYELPAIPGFGYLKTNGDTGGRFRAADVSQVVAALVAKMAGQASRAFQVWQPPLAPVYTVDSLLPPLAPGERGLAPTDMQWVGLLRAPVGVVDKPFEQHHGVLVLDFSGATGHAAVIGEPKSGKSTALRTIVLSLALLHTPREAQFYCLDFAGGALMALRDLPQVGAVVSHDRADEVVRLLASVISARERLFRQQDIGSMGEFRSRRWQGQLPDQQFGDVFLVVDGWRNLPPALAAPVVDLVTRGLSYGVHVITSAERWAEILPAAKDMFGSRLELRLADPAESDIEQRVASHVPTGQPGRGVTTDKLHVQVALPRIDGRQTVDDAEAGLRDVVARIRQEWRGPVAPPLPTASRAIEIGKTTGEHAPVPVTIDFDAEPHFLVIGDSESGKTNLLRTIVRGITDQYTDREALIMLVDYRRHTFGFLTSNHLLAYAVMPKQLTEIMTDVVSSLRKRMPGPNTTQEQLRDRSWWSGPELFVVVDDYELVSTPAGNPLESLREFLPHAKDVGLHVVIARSSAPAALTEGDPVIGTLKELGCAGVVLSVPSGQGPQLGTYQPVPLPAGRGVLVTRRTGHQVTQLTWTEPPPR